LALPFPAISAVCSGSGEDAETSFQENRLDHMVQHGRGQDHQTFGARLGNLPVQASMATLTPSRAKSSIWIATRLDRLLADGDAVAIRQQGE
jgi:hypothetical protein